MFHSTFLLPRKKFNRLDLQEMVINFECDSEHLLVINKLTVGIINIEHMLDMRLIIITSDLLTLSTGAV